MISHNYLHYASWYGTNSNPPWLEIPLSRTNFHGPKGVRAIEVRLYIGKQIGNHKLRSFTYSFVLCGCSIYFSSILQIGYVKVRMSRSTSESSLDFEITRIDCMWKRNM